MSSQRPTRARGMVLNVACTGPVVLFMPLLWMMSRQSFVRVEPEIVLLLGAVTSTVVIATTAGVRRSSPKR